MKKYYLLIVSIDRILIIDLIQVIYEIYEQIYESDSSGAAVCF